jgi:hypothetical protein
MSALNYDALKTAKAALDDGLITQTDYDAVKESVLRAQNSILRAQQIKAGLDAGVIPEEELENVKRAFLESLSLPSSASPGVPAGESGRQLQLFHELVHRLVMCSWCRREHARWSGNRCSAAVSAQGGPKPCQQSRCQPPACASPAPAPPRPRSTASRCSIASQATSHAGAAVSELGPCQAGPHSRPHKHPQPWGQAA